VKIKFEEIARFFRMEIKQLICLNGGHFLFLEVEKFKSPRIGMLCMGTKVSLAETNTFFIRNIILLERKKTFGDFF
jgi:hypothetical protein